MPYQAREARVLAAVVDLVDSLLEGFDVVELLTDLTGHCARLLDVPVAGFLLADPRGRLHLMAATSEKPLEVELLQLQAEEGPCLDCLDSGLPVSAADLQTATGRWPQFAPAATDAGFAAVHAVPMRAAGTVLGALVLFDTSAGALPEADLLVAQTLSHVACVAILQDRPVVPLPRLRTALTSRVVVEQAKGFLRGDLDVSLEDAFALLRGYAHTHDTHLTEVARRVIAEPDQRGSILAAIRGAGVDPLGIRSDMGEDEP